MTAVFPAHLAKGIAEGSWTEQRRPQFTEFETDSGFSIRSKIPGSARVTCGFNIIYTADEVDDLNKFYINDCVEGSVSFYMEYPVTGDNRVFQWAEPPRISHVSGSVATFTAAFSLIME